MTEPDAEPDGEPDTGHDGHDGQYDDEYVDELPEDLDLSGFVGPHTFPNNNRRRIPAVLYLLIGLACVGLWVGRGDGSPLVNGGTLAAGIGLVLFAVYGLVAGWTLRIDESDALVAASSEAGFPVGHAAAQMVWRGWLSRPTWRILLYSAENPPSRRGFALVDGIDGRVVESFTEENPEDWSGFDPADVDGTSSPAS
ncbi:MAG: hypothetical protein V9E94_12805 [Microthrixaceae bacterium]